MSSSVQITVLVENTCMSPGLIAEHGIAFWIDTGSHYLLFDTGQGKALQHNARRMNINLSLVDTIALSHGHYDHIGGLGVAVNAADHPRIFAHPDIMQLKFSKDRSGFSREVSFISLLEELTKNNGSLFNFNKEMTNPCDGFMLTGEIPRITDFEDTGGAFYLDENGQTPDPLMDDQALFFETKEGTVILSGCAHSGIVNTLEYVSKLTGNKKIHAVIGGFHLVKASPYRIEKSIEAFKQYGVQQIGLGHCTGMNAIVEFWKAFPNQCFHCTAGTRVKFEI